MDRAAPRHVLRCFAISGEGAGHLALEDPEIVQRNVREGIGRDAEVLCQNFRRRMYEPIRDKQRIEFVGMAVVEADHELAAVGPESLQRMRRAAGKYQRSPALTSPT